MPKKRASGRTLHPSCTVGRCGFHKGAACFNAGRCLHAKDACDDLVEGDLTDERARQALGLPPLQRDDTPSLDTSFHDREMDV